MYCPWYIAWKRQSFKSLKKTASLQAVFESSRGRCVCPSVCRHHLCAGLRLWTGSLVIGPDRAPAWASVVIRRWQCVWQWWVCVCVHADSVVCAHGCVHSQRLHESELSIPVAHNILTRTQLLSRFIGPRHAHHAIGCYDTADDYSPYVNTCMLLFKGGECTHTHTHTHTHIQPLMDICIWKAWMQRQELNMK